MSPLELAGAFAQIVGLICNFISIRKDRSNDYNEFIEWIKEHHKEINDLINRNSSLADEIKVILNQDRSIILSKLEERDNLLASISISLREIGGLAKAVKPGVELSEQSISILKQLVKSNGSKILLEDRVKNRIASLLLLDGSGDIEIQEEKFLKDDLDRLVEVGLLRHDLNDRGYNIYILTRNASNFIESLQ